MTFELKNISDMLRFYQSTGIDVFFDSVPNNFYLVKNSADKFNDANDNNYAKSESNNESVYAKKNQENSESDIFPDDKLYATSDAVKQADDIAKSSNNLENLRLKTEASDFCQLKKYATNTVFGEGVEHNPDVMIIGEAPGADEDKQGRPFVGVSGKLMDKIFESVGVSRVKNAYITNIVKWRPPGNRTPTREECLVCMPILRRQIELIRPKIIVLAGGVSAGAMLNITEGITRIRGRVFDYKIDDEKTVKVIPTFHPSYLLRSPAGKKFSYIDAISIANFLQAI